MSSVERIDMGHGSTQAADASQSSLREPTVGTSSTTSGASWGDQGHPTPPYDTELALLLPGISSTPTTSGNQESGASARRCLERYYYLLLQYYTPQPDAPGWDIGVTLEGRVLRTYMRALRAYGDHFR